jgi:hypothetical protein
MKQTFSHVSTSARGVGLYRLLDAETKQPVGDGTIYVSSKTVFGGFPATVEIEFEASAEFVAEQEANKAKAAAKAAEKEAKEKAKAARAEAKAKIDEARAALKAAREGAATKPAETPAAPAETPAAQ